MTYYKIYSAGNISEQHIHTILRLWDIADWNNLTAKEFRATFADSEFHVLMNDKEDMLSIARINFNFNIRVQECVYKFSEFVGFVAAQKGKGYGTALLTHLVKNLQERKIETIGFCDKNLRQFYKKANVKVLYDAAKYLREKTHDRWVTPDDDDILCISLGEDTMKLLKSLSPKKLGYLVAE